jgi:predicted SnoaL-like aldol condensation-catalyzing enzyme
MPATGKAIDVEAIDLVRIDDNDLMVEHWGAFEEGKMMRQLGLLPE